ncbi:MAG: hypothetical protein JO165_02855, partial [Candidatus Eremiobacteraeota bacterium]|nr:hypothetical protein [Candidatus Eremiobacteraeota bacterium]
IVALSGPPPGGTYTLAVQAVQNGHTTTANVSATLNGATILSPLPQPTITSTGDGGATIGLPVLPPGITQVIANVIDANVPPAQPAPPALPCPTGIANTTVVFTSAGTQRIPSNLGIGGSPTFCTGDTLAVYAYGFDYDEIALGPPGNMSPSPSLPAQADVTVAPPNTTTE